VSAFRDDQVYAWQQKLRMTSSEGADMNRTTITGILLATSLLVGCNRNDTVQPAGIGPAERAGRAVDNAGARVADTMQAQVQKADEAARQLRDKADATARQARENVQDVTQEASRNLDRATEAVGKKVEQAGEKIQQAAH
jgi:hypothetical protein